MNSKILIHDLKKLFYKNKKTIFAITGILTVLVLLLFTSFTFFGNKSEEDPLLINENQSNPGIFRFYVEQEDGTIYINSMIVEEYLLLPEVISDAERTTGVEITDVLDLEIEEDFVKTQYDRGALGISRNGSTNIFTFIANVGTEEENLAVANFYYDYLMDENIDMLNNKLVYVVSEPEIYDEDSYAASDIVINDSISSDESGLSILELLVTGIAGAVFGLFSGFLFVVIKNLLAKTINYSFTYSVSDMDQVQLMTDDNQHFLARLLLNSKENPTVILSEQPLPNKIMEILTVHPDLHVINNTSKMDEKKVNVIIVDSIEKVDLSVQIQNPIIFVQTFNTTKKWYKRVFRNIHNIDANAIIIQID